MAIKKEQHIICWVLLVFIGLTEARQPYGPRMCEQLCRSVVGCSAYRYQACQLHCSLAKFGDRVKLQDKLWVSYHLTKADPASQINTVNCITHSRITQTRRGIIHCDQDITSPPMMSRMILVPYNKHEKSKFYQVDLHSIGSLQVFSFPRLSRVLDIMYLHSTKKLFVSTYRRKRILSTSIDQPVLKEFHNKAAKVMTSDEDRKLIFMAMYPITTIFRMNIEGNNTKSCSYRIRFVHSLAVFVKHKILYIATLYSLGSSTYDLEDFQVLDRQRRITAMTIDPLGEYVIYNKDRTMYRRSLTGTKTEMHPSLILKPMRLRYHDANIYISYNSRDEQNTLAVKNNKTVVPIPTNSIPARGSLLFAVIP